MNSVNCGKPNCSGFNSVRLIKPVCSGIVRQTSRVELETVFWWQPKPRSVIWGTELSLDQLNECLDSTRHFCPLPETTTLTWSFFRLDLLCLTVDENSSSSSSFALFSFEHFNGDNEQSSKDETHSWISASCSVMYSCVRIPPPALFGDLHRKIGIAVSANPNRLFRVVTSW